MRTDEPPDDVVTDLPIEGTGRLYCGDRAVCTVNYRLIGWREVGRRTDQDAGDVVEVRGSLRGVERATFFEFVGRDDLSLDLQQKNLWWNCRILTTWGNAVSRGGGLHRRSG